MKLRAYKAEAKFSEGCVLVFACGIREAKRKAFSNEWFDDAEWIELTVRRYPAADEYAEQFGPGCVECNTEEQQRMHRDLGWYELEHSSECCEQCGRHAWSMVPESQVEWTDRDLWLCRSCLLETMGAID